MKEKIEIKKDLQETIQAIGRCRATGEGDLDLLRKRRAELENELSELDAEDGYIETKLAQDVEAEKQDAIAQKVNAFTLQTDAFRTAFTHVEKSLEKLNALEKEFDEAVDVFFGVGNPLMLLNAVWKDLEPEKQSELSDQIHAVFDLRGKVPSTLEAAKILESLNGRVATLAMQLGQFRVNPSMKTPRGRGMFTTKSPGQKTNIVVPPKIPATSRDHGMRSVPHFNRNKPAGQQFIRNAA